VTYSAPPVAQQAQIANNAGAANAASSSSGYLASTASVSNATGMGGGGGSSSDENSGDGNSLPPANSTSDRFSPQVERFLALNGIGSLSGLEKAASSDGISLTEEVNNINAQASAQD